LGREAAKARRRSRQVFVFAQPQVAKAQRAFQQVKVAVDQAGQQQPTAAVDLTRSSAAPLRGIGISAAPRDAVPRQRQGLGPGLLRVHGIHAGIADQHGS
jgi:hypothetical protein